MNCTTRKTRGGYLGGGLLLLSLMICLAGPLGPACGATAVEAKTDAQATVARELGIIPVATRLTAAGNMIDFRFRVLDADKSRPLFDKQVPTWLAAAGRSEKFTIPVDSKLGPIRSSSRTPLVGREYFILFRNPDRLLKKGSAVAVVNGERRLDGLTLE